MGLKRKAETAIEPDTQPKHPRQEAAPPLTRKEKARAAAQDAARRSLLASPTKRVKHAYHWTSSPPKPLATVPSNATFSAVVGRKTEVEEEEVEEEDETVRGQQSGKTGQGCAAAEKMGGEEAEAEAEAESKPAQQPPKQKNRKRKSKTATQVDADGRPLRQPEETDRAFGERLHKHSQNQRRRLMKEEEERAERCRREEVDRNVIVEIAGNASVGAMGKPTKAAAAGGKERYVQCGDDDHDHDDYHDEGEKENIVVGAATAAVDADVDAGLDKGNKSKRGSVGAAAAKKKNEMLKGSRKSLRLSGGG